MNFGSVHVMMIALTTTVYTNSVLASHSIESPIAVCMEDRGRYDVDAYEEMVGFAGAIGVLISLSIIEVPARCVIQMNHCVDL